jgi:trimeric autotransporter adhesin
MTLKRAPLITPPALVLAGNAVVSPPAGAGGLVEYPDRIDGPYEGRLRALPDGLEEKVMSIMLKALRGVVPAACVAVGLLAVATTASAATLNVCVPEAEGATVVTPKARVCKAKYNESRLLSKAEAAELEEIKKHITYEASGIDGKPTVVVSGANVQVVNGEGKTATTNGEGNLVIGYDENEYGLCTEPGFTTKQECEAEGQTWNVEHHAQTGSHNLVLGEEQTFTSYGGILAGSFNATGAPFASVTGGQENAASAEYASVSGGLRNDASGYSASVGGGQNNHATALASTVAGGEVNTASKQGASVSGGVFNEAGQQDASISGGDKNKASGLYAWIGGGFESTASGEDASVSGGGFNVASGSQASVSGGKTNNASGLYGWIGGGYKGTASGEDASISGGEWNFASGARASVSGGYENAAEGPRASVSGGALNNASGTGASITAGEHNEADNEGTSVSGGEWNRAENVFDWIGGGADNEAKGGHSALLGGFRGDATGPWEVTWGSTCPWSGKEEVKCEEEAKKTREEEQRGGY